MGVIIVTGASRGIGAATARLLGRSGHAVCVNYRSSAERAADVVRDIEAAGGRALAVAADTADEADVMRLFETVDRELGTLTGLVNNAGIVGRPGKVAEIDAAGLRELLDVNVMGCFLCAREAVKRMSRTRGGAGGAIVNVSSRAAALGGANEWVHYAASKGAIDTFTIGLAKELGPEHVRVNAVRPGLIDTEIHSGVPGRLQTLVSGVPLGRIGSPDEVAAVIAWLLSDEAAYVSGALVDVSGAR